MIDSQNFIDTGDTAHTTHYIFCTHLQFRVLSTPIGHGSTSFDDFVQLDFQLFEVTFMPGNDLTELRGVIDALRKLNNGLHLDFEHQILMATFKKLLCFLSQDSLKLSLRIISHLRITSYQEI